VNVVEAPALSEVEGGRISVLSLAPGALNALVEPVLENSQGFQFVCCLVQKSSFSVLRLTVYSFAKIDLLR
jgi:hypothetical protein